MELWLQILILSSAKIRREVNYKEKVSWSFRSLGSGSLGKEGDSESSPRVGDNNIKDGYLSNRFLYLAINI